MVQAYTDPPSVDAGTAVDVGRKFVGEEESFHGGWLGAPGGCRKKAKKEWGLSACGGLFSLRFEPLLDSENVEDAEAFFDTLLQGKLGMLGNIEGGVILDGFD